MILHGEHLRDAVAFLLYSTSVRGNSAEGLSSGFDTRHHTLDDITPSRTSHPRWQARPVLLQTMASLAKPDEQVVGEESTSLDQKADYSKKTITSQAEIKSEIAEKSKLMNQMDGVESAGDTYVFGLDDAAAQLHQTLVDTGDARYNFESLPLALFGKTTKDLCRGYALWSRKDNDPADRFNVTKARLRMDNLAKWSDKHKAVITKEPFDEELCTAILYTMGVFLPKRDEQNKKFIWVVDLALWDTKGMSKYSWETQLRAMVYIFTKISFEADAQLYGLTLVESLHYMNLFKLMGIVDRNVKSITDELLMGCGCLKVKKIYLAEAHWFLRGMMSVMGMFLSTKVMSRFLSVGSDWKVLYDGVGGCEKVPVGCGPNGSGDVEDRWLGLKNHTAEGKRFEV